MCTFFFIEYLDIFIHAKLQLNFLLILLNKGKIYIYDWSTIENEY